jgi:hypothetical protein
VPLEHLIHSDLFAQLELLEAGLSSLPTGCDCQGVACVVVEASNLRKWMRLLFAEQESKLQRSSIKVPLQLIQIKSEISELSNRCYMKSIPSRNACCLVSARARDGANNPSGAKQNQYRGGGTRRRQH